MTKRFRPPAFTLSLVLASAAIQAGVAGLTTPAHARTTETRRLVGVVTEVIYDDEPGNSRRIFTIEYDTPDGAQTFQFERYVRCPSSTGSYFPGEFVEMEVNDAAQLVWLDHQSWGPEHPRQ
jgi:hypothetical protein